MLHGQDLIIIFLAVCNSVHGHPPFFRARTRILRYIFRDRNRNYQMIFLSNLSSFDAYVVIVKKFFGKKHNDFLVLPSLQILLSSRLAELS